MPINSFLQIFKSENLAINFTSSTVNVLYNNNVGIEDIPRKRDRFMVPQIQLFMRSWS